MRSITTCLLTASALLGTPVANAGSISGFENGLSDWAHIGDVSVQTAASGLTPTEGRNAVFLTTLSAAWNEVPYSATSSPSSAVARAFLGIETITPPGCCDEPYMAGFPMVDTALPGGGTFPYAIRGESAAIKTQFSTDRAGYLSFDWDRIGRDADNAYFTIWNDITGSRINGWIYEPHIYAGGFSAVDVGLCARTTSLGDGCGIYDTHTDWHTLSVWIGTPGTYNIGFGMNEIAESTAPTILAIDNVQFTVPEPASAALIALAMVGLALARRRRPQV